MVLSVCANPSVDSFWSIESINKGTINRSNNESFYPGGKGIHVVMALNELGENTSSLSVWGGMTGRWIKEQCEQQGISTLGPIIDDWTRICITNKSKNEWQDTELLGAGPSLNHKDTEQFLRAYSQSLENEPVDAVTISGSVPTGFNNNIYNKLITIAKNHDTPAFLDAGGELLRQGLKAKPFGVHVNLDEGSTLTEHSDPIKIATLLQQKCNVAAVTAGKDGLYLATKDGALHATHQLNQQQIISTIGAGDCLLAGLCKAFLHTDNVMEWARLSTACGSANCIHPKLGMLNSNKVDQIKPNVKVEQVANV